MKICMDFCIIGFFLMGYLDAAAIDPVVEEHKWSSSEEISKVPPTAINEDCHQPRETGRCFALFYRFSFNVEKQQCEEFIYGGCGANKNNFETLNECERHCLSPNEFKESNTTNLPSNAEDNVLVTQTTEKERNQTENL